MPAGLGGGRLLTPVPMPAGIRRSLFVFRALKAPAASGWGSCTPSELGLSGALACRQHEAAEPNDLRPPSGPRSLPAPSAYSAFVMPIGPRVAEVGTAGVVWEGESAL